MDLIFPRMIYLRRTIKKSSKTPNCSTLSTYARKRCTCAPAGLLSTRENETANKFPAVQWPKKVDISRLYRVTERGIRTDWLFSRDTRVRARPSRAQLYRYHSWLLRICNTFFALSINFFGALISFYHCLSFSSLFFFLFLFQWTRCRELRWWNYYKYPSKISEHQKVIIAQNTLETFLVVM